MIKDNIMKELEDILGKGLETNEAKLREYAVDVVCPAAVVIPSSVEQIAEVVSLASKNDLALVVRGGGTKMNLGYRPERVDLMLDTSYLNRVTDMDTANLTVTAQAGVVFGRLQDTLSGQENRCYESVSTDGTSGTQVCSVREHMGCFVPLDPPFSTGATLGGIVAANSSGPRRFLYGTMRDILLGVRYVNAEGRVIGMGGKTVKNVSGYDVSKLLIGSMGTLGVICEMTLRLLPLPEQSATTIMEFETFELAFSMVDKILASSLIPAAVEVFDATIAEMTNALSPVGRSKYCVAVLAEGAKEVVERIGLDVKNMAMEMGSLATVWLKDDKHMDFWKAYGEIGRLPVVQEDGTMVIRLSCPIARLKELLKSAIEGYQKLNLEGHVWAHAGSGVGRIILEGGERNEQLEGQMAEWVDDMLKASIAVGGNIIIEKSDYPLKAELPVWGAPRGDFDILRRIKQEIDPKGIFSPGRFVVGI